jgi:hypothetical protein
MADLACLEVNSRTASATQSWSVILKVRMDLARRADAQHPPGRELSL